MSKNEIANQFEEMIKKAKKIVKEGAPVQSLCFGISEAAAQMGGKNPEHAIYCLEEGKRRIEELMKYAKRV